MTLNRLQVPCFVLSSRRICFWIINKNVRFFFYCIIQNIWTNIQLRSAWFDTQPHSWCIYNPSTFLLGKPFFQRRKSRQGLVTAFIPKMRDGPEVADAPMPRGRRRRRRRRSLGERNEGSSTRCCSKFVIQVACLPLTRGKACKLQTGNKR